MTNSLDQIHAIGLLRYCLNELVLDKSSVTRALKIIRGFRFPRHWDSERRSEAHRNAKAIRFALEAYPASKAKAALLHRVEPLIEMWEAR